MTCAVCSRDGGPAPHAECVLLEALLAVVELIAVVATPVVLVWAS